jgi:hypothetical protein
MRILQTLAAAAMLAAAASPVAAQSDVTGTWTASFVTADRTYPARIELKQESEKLTGMVGSTTGTEGNKVSGTVKANEVTFEFLTQDPNGGGRTLAIAVKASITADGLTGSFNVDDAPTGTFTAKREAKDSKEAKAPAASADAKASATDVAGTWAFTVDLGSITASPTVVLKQDGQKLTGTYTSPQYGQFPLQGTVKGDDVQFDFTMTIEGNALDVHFKGTADKEGLKGSVNYGGLGEGTFIGKKK